MNFPDKHQILRVSFWTGVAILFAAPLDVFNGLLSFLHTLFEWTEASLDFMIDAMFDTTLQTTQIVVFYIIVAAIFYGFYRLWKGFPDFYDHQKANLSGFLSDEMEAILVYWQESVSNKLKLSVTVAGLIFLLFI